MRRFADPLRTKIALAILTVGLSPAWSPAEAQKLYDPARDATAKQGADAAGKLATGDLWEKMLRNLDKLSTEDINAYLLDQQVKMRATIDNMRLWSQVDKDVEQVGSTLGAEGFLTAAQIAAQGEKLAQQQKDLDSQVADSRKAVTELTKQKSTVPSVLQPVFDNLGDIDGAVQKLHDIAASGPAGTAADRLAEGVAVLKQIQSVFATADQGLKNVDAVRAQLTGFETDVQQAVLLRLQADEEHLKNQVAIIARRAQEERDLLRILRDYQALRRRIQPAANGLVADSLAEAGARGRDAVFDQAQALYDATALAARGQTPAALEALRMAQEEERYSIRKSAAEARVYEQLLNGGARRLALFYAGGVKPETVAQLLFNALSLANLGYLTYAK